MKALSFTVGLSLLAAMAAGAAAQGPSAPERLHAAAQRGDAKAVNDVLAAGVDVDAKDARGQKIGRAHV